MASIKCCVCGEATSISPVAIEDEKALLPDESSDRHSVYGKAIIWAITDADSDLFYYGIFKCQACQSRFIGQKHYDSGKWVAVYPIPHKTAAQEIPEPIAGEFEEANLCFSIGAYRATVAMCEVALESMWREQQSSGLNDLKDKGLISTSLFNRATEVRLWANVAKHELVPDVVEKEDAEQLLVYLESILQHVYIEPSKLDALKKKREDIENKD